MLCGNGVDIIVTADLHGDLAALAYLAGTIRNYPQAIKVDLGDFAQSSFPVVWQNGLPVIRALNALGFDILVPGNHDLEFPVTVMETWRQRFRGRIMGAQWSLGKFRMPGAAVIERNGFRIGFIALGETGLQKRVPFWPELHYDDELTVLKPAVSELLRQRCHAIILLAHISTSNYPVYYRILRDFPEIDAVAGAHSHREMPGGIMKRVLFCQPGARAGSAVLLTLHFSAEKQLRFITSRLLRPSETADAAVMEIAGKAEEAAKAAGNVILGKFSDAEKFGRSAAEAVRRISGTDAAIVGFDPAYFHPELTLNRIYELFPYGNRIAVVEVNGNTAAALRNLRRGKIRYFGAGDFSKERLRLAVSDYMLISSPLLKNLPGRISEKFERQEIIGFLKNGEYPENTH